MKFLEKDITSIAEIVPVDLTTDFSLRIQPLAVTWHLDVAALLTEPIAPDGNKDDPEYKTEEARYNTRFSLLLIIDSVVPGQIQFKASKKSLTFEEYLDACGHELADAGFSGKQIKKLVDAILDLNGYGETVMNEVQPDFFAQTGS